jgi:hypothetical protein
MPIMAVQDQRDARGTAWVLANTARRCIDEFTYQPTDKIALNGVFQLLKAYKVHRLAAFDNESRSSRPKGALPSAPAAERHMPELRRALSAALSTAYRGRGEDEAIEDIERVFRSLARKEAEEPELIRQTSAFLDCFVRNLQAAV